MINVASSDITFARFNMNKLLDRLSYKYGKICIPNLMFYIVLTMAAAYVVNIFVPNINFNYYLIFNRELIMQGEWWRVFSWIFLPPSNNLVGLVFNLYFYYFIGTGLEQAWGSFKFNVYYLVGIIATIISGFIIGGTTNSYLNLSLFFAAAVLYPNLELRLFFFLPIKMKWLGLINLAYFVCSLIIGTTISRVAILVAMLNFFLFFWSDFIKFIKNQIFYFKHRQRFKNNRK